MTITGTRPAPPPAAPASHGRPRSWWLAATLGAVIVLLLAGTVGYHLGVAREGPHIASGRAYVGEDEVGLRSDGWSYGFTPSATTWLDARGVVHGTGTAPCLRRAGHHADVRLGWSRAGFGSQSWRQVDWVRCTATP